MTPLQPFKPKDFANLFTPVTTSAIIASTLPIENGFSDPSLRPGNGKSNTLLYVGIGVLTIGLIAVVAVVIHKHNEVASKLSRLSFEMKMNHSLLTSTKLSNNANAERSIGKPESEQVQKREEDLNKI